MAGATRIRPTPEPLQHPPAAPGRGSLPQANVDGRPACLLRNKARQVRATRIGPGWRAGWANRNRHSHDAGNLDPTPGEADVNAPTRPGLTAGYA